MIFSRSIVALFFLSVFALFVAASPRVSDSEIAARSTEQLIKRHNKTCSTKGCNEEPILAILKELTSFIELEAGKCDGKVDPKPHVTLICAEIKKAITKLAEVPICLISEVGDLFDDILKCICHIIVALATMCWKYGWLILVDIAVSIDLVLCQLVKVLCKCLPALLAHLKLNLKTYAAFFAKVQFFFTKLACGL